VINKPFFEAVPASRNQGFESLLQKVYHQGDRIVIDEMPLTLEKRDDSDTMYIKFVYEALRDEDGKISGVMVLADEITEQVRARKELEEIEIRQKIAIEAAAIGTFDWDIVNSVFHYSDRLAQIFGYTETRSLKQNDFGNRIHPDDQPMRMKAHEDAFANGTLFYEARVLWPDQSLHWVRLNGKVTYDTTGRPSRMYGTTLDITEQRQQSERLEKLVEQRTRKLQERNRELQQSEERYHKMVEEVQDYAIILLDREGNVVNWNRGAEKIKGYQESEIIGKNFRLFYLPEDRENNLPERLINDAETKGRATHEGWRMRKNGSKFWGSITITALYNDKREIIGFSKVTRDLTERKITEDSLKAYAVGLEFQNRELEQFAYVASHDLQEPLRKIQTFCEVIQRSNYDLETTAKFFPKILNSAQRMSELIRSVLNYSRLSKEGQTFTPIDLNGVMTTIQNDFELLIEEKNAKIEVEKLPSIEGIPLQVNQLFTNLIGNALKFNKGEPIVQIKSREISPNEILNAPGSLPDKKYVEISVADNGIGFEQRHEQVIFAMFQRLNSKQEYSGTGIGLALCKKIMDNHNGHITAQSEPGKGSVFFIYFPID
jgi:PAS domain S-box-containing protein